MNLKHDKTRINIIVAIVLVILFVTWWINGQDDTWLYVTSALAVSTLFFPFLFKGKDK